MEQQVTQRQIDNFWDKVLFTTDCWEWQASLDKNGYGWFGTQFGKKAHRFVYFITHGSLSKDLQIDQILIFHLVF